MKAAGCLLGNASSCLITEVKLVVGWETSKPQTHLLPYYRLVSVETELAIGRFRLGGALNPGTGPAYVRCQAGVGNPGEPPYVTPRGSARKINQNSQVIN